MHTWSPDAVFYHIYPLGLCAAPAQNDFQAAPCPRLESLLPWAAHIQSLGCNAVYLGPLFESGTHGYDTADYYNVDRRLGTRSTLAEVVRAFHQRGIRVVLDGVFNHVGRDFWAFRDLLARGPDSPYAGWFSGLRFGQPNHRGDPFTYDTWDGLDTLVKLNLHHPEVREHLRGAVTQWIQDYDIDGLRLDAADVVDLGFLQTLAAHCRRLRPDFWLMGEGVHGDYARWANPQTLDATTNYEAYKGLYSSLNDANYFEIAYALNRQFGSAGLYRGLPLYNFADNHDVDRVASRLHNPAHVFPLYALLFSMPGVPSIYYGSEFGLGGVKGQTDAPLRPALDLSQLAETAPQPALPAFLRQLSEVRRQLPALRRGGYRPAHVAHQQLAFWRELDGQRVLAAFNAAEEVTLTLELDGCAEGFLEDSLHPGAQFAVQGGRVQLPLPARGARILLWQPR